MDNIELYFDLIFIVLLSLMIFYSLRLTKQLKDFRNQKTDFKSIIKELSSSFGEADKNIKGFQNFAQESHGDFEKKLIAAQGLSDELKFMIESADRIATRLEKANSGDVKKKEPSSDEQIAAIDYYKETNPASSAARREAALSMTQGSSKISQLDRKRSEKTSIQARSQGKLQVNPQGNPQGNLQGNLQIKSRTEKDLLKVLKVKTR